MRKRAQIVDRGARERHPAAPVMPLALLITSRQCHVFHLRGYRLIILCLRDDLTAPQEPLPRKNAYAPVQRLDDEFLLSSAVLLGIRAQSLALSTMRRVVLPLVFAQVLLGTRLLKSQLVVRKAKPRLSS